MTPGNKIWYSREMNKKKKSPVQDSKLLKKSTKTINKLKKREDNIPVVSQRQFTARKYAFYIIMGVVVVLFAILSFFVYQHPYFALDLTVTREIQEFNPPWFQFLMNTLTFVGNPINSAIITLLTVGFFYMNKRTIESSLLFASTAGATIIATIMKLLIHRPRPDPKLIHQVNHFTVHDSFPSGHVLFYVGFFGFLLYLTYTLPQHNKYRSLLLIVLSLMILLIGPSRMFVGAHWFSDVMGAYLIGFVWLSIIILIYNRAHPKVTA